jgi:hypothetical protein
MSKRTGRKSAAQTPAPPSEHIKGSTKNPKGSAASEKSASKIELSSSILAALKAKLSEFKKEKPSKKNITLNDLKAVYRRGAGAYSSSHRPTISGGKPNTRNAWAMARVNKFLKKASGEKVKAAYVQDDDLMKMHLGGDMSKHLAPNGKPSNLTHEQWHLVRTPEFKAWFGDWENDPANASKVVDSNGEPLVCYHGTNAEINIFDIQKIHASGESVFKFTTSYQMARGYGKNVYAVFLSIKNNEIGHWSSPKKGLSKFYANTTFDKARLDLVYESKKADESQGGVIYGLISNDLNYNGDVYFVHFPNQIKLADGTNTTFDGSNPDIRFDDGGKLNDCVEYVKQNKSILDNGYFLDLSKFSKSLPPEVNIPSSLNFTLVTYNSGGQKDLKVVDTINSMQLMKQLSPFLNLDFAPIAQALHFYRENAQRITNAEILKGSKVIIVDRDKIVCENLSVYEDGGDILMQDTVQRMDNPHLADIAYYSNGGYMINDKGLLKSVYPAVKEMLAGHGIGINEEYGLTDGSNKSYIPYFAMEREGDMLKKVGVTYYGDAMEVLGEIEVEIEDDGGIEIELEFPEWSINEERKLYEIGGKLGKISASAFNNKMKKELRFIKQDAIQSGYKGEEVDAEVNSTIAFSYYQYIAKKLGFEFSEIEHDNKSKKPKNHFQLTMQVYDKKNNKGYVLWSAFVYVDDNHMVDEDRSNVQLLDADTYETVHIIHDRKGLNFAKGGMLSDEEKGETYKKWKSLVNMSKSELERFYNSEEGKVAGLSASEAKKQGIDSGRESARWIMKMKSTPVGKWTPAMWRWAKKQISFISRMSGNKGKLYDEKGRKTRKHLSLLIWGNNPEKYAHGGKVKDDFIFDPQNNDRGVNALGNLEIDGLTQGMKNGGFLNKKLYKMETMKFNELPHIATLNEGDMIVLTESVFSHDGKYECERTIEAKVAEKMPFGKVNMVKLLITNSDYEGYCNFHVLRPINNVMKKGRLLQKKQEEPTSFKEGGEINPDNKSVKEYFAHGSGNVGGVLVGKRHSEGGIKAINKSTGQPLEMEGGEVVITRGAVSNPKKYDFDGKDMTTREILSKLNVDGGGVSFAEGGDIPDKMNCGCDNYKIGGSTMTLNDFVSMSEQEYQQERLKAGMEKERIDHYETLAKLNAGFITVEDTLREIAKKEMKIDPKYPFSV